MVTSTGYFDPMIIVNNVYNDLLVFMKIFLVNLIGIGLYQ